MSQRCCHAAAVTRCPSPAVTQAIVLTATGCRTVPGSGLCRPLARFAAAVCKSPPEAPGGKPELTGRAVTTGVGVPVSRAGCHGADGEQSAQLQLCPTAPAMPPRAPSHRLPGLSWAARTHWPEFALPAPCLSIDCGQDRASQYCCFPPPVQHHQSEASCHHLVEQDVCQGAEVLPHFGPDPMLFGIQEWLFLTGLLWQEALVHPVTLARWGSGRPMQGLCP